MVGEDDYGPQFFIQAARDYQKSKHAEEALRQPAIADKKVAAVAKKLQKEKEKEEKAQNAAVRRQLQAEAAAQKVAEKLALQEAKQAAATLKRQQSATENMSKTPKKA